MAEEKKKVATKTTATKKRNTTKPKVETREEEFITDINKVSPELMQQMFNMFLSMQNQNAEEKKKVNISIEDKPKKITKSYLRSIKDREVVVRSVFGTVVFKSPKTRISYKWTEIGDEEILTVDEILAMDSHSKRFLNTPWLIIEDEEVVEGLGLAQLYDVIKKIENTDELLEMYVGDIEALVSKAPHEYKKTLAGVIFEKVDSGEIRDIVLIREFERILGVTLLL